MKVALTLALVLLTASNTFADQPILNKMPRWDNGYGWQVVNEHTYKRDLLDGSRTLGGGLYEEVNRVHLEGVYTWDKSIRITLKVPFIVDATRTLLDDSGNIFRQKTSGLDDITLGLPLKKYFNKDGYSGNWSLTPQVIIPTGETRGDYTLPDQSWGTGLGFGYEIETHGYFFAIGATVWEMHSDEPFEAKANIDLGINFADRGQVSLETDYLYEDNGTEVLVSGPALYWRFTDTVHSKIEWKYGLSDRQGEIDHGNQNTVKFSLGWVF